MKVDWNCVSIRVGGQSAPVHGLIKKLKLFADSLDIALKVVVYIYMYVFC